MTVNPINLAVGIVEDLDDPEKLGRVRVRFPHLDDQVSHWARLVSAGAGAGRGSFFRPEPGDEVMVSFVHGDTRRPVVLGGVWSTQDKPPDESLSADNDVRQIVSRSGHIVRLDDAKGGERIEIIASGGDQVVVLDRANNRIEITATKGDVVVKASSGSVTVTSSNDLTLEATGNMTIKANGSLTLRGSSVSIN